MYGDDDGMAAEHVVCTKLITWGRRRVTVSHSVNHCKTVTCK